MTLCVLNDLHLGAVRTGGTTPATAYQLRLDLLSQFEDLLYQIDSDLMILGDLFDGPDISKSDLLQAYRVLDSWLVRSGKNLIMVNGNHDLSKRSDMLSSFQFLVALLQAEGAYPGTVTHIAEGTMTPHGYVIPHVTNQELFNIELAKVPECDYLFVHCNYDNQFAVESDHSLNMSREQAEAVPVKHIIFAHEHQARIELDGKVRIIGNQFPSSISDCLGNLGKQYALITPAGCSHMSSWTAMGDYREADWQALAGMEQIYPERFIRVVGTAQAHEAAAVTTAISRFRQASGALVITNAVKIAGIDDAAEIQLTHETVTAFNVREALRELLTPEENEKIDKLPRTQNA